MSNATARWVGFSLRQQAEEHREEPVDRIRVLAVARDEAVDRQGVEGSECQRVAVDEQKGRLCGVRHGVSLARSPTHSRAHTARPH